MATRQRNNMKSAPGRAFLPTEVFQLEEACFASETLVTVMPMARCTRHMALNTLALLRVTVVTIRAHGNTLVICSERQ